MSENHEQNSPSEDTSVDQPESSIPEDAVLVDTADIDRKLQDQMEKGELGEIPLREPVIEPLAPPYRVVIWFRYDDLRKQMDEYWRENEDRIVGALKVKGKKAKGGKILGARKMVEQRYPLKRVYGDLLTKLVSEKIEDDILFFDGMELFDFQPDKSPQLVTVVYFTPSLKMSGEINWAIKKPQIVPKSEMYDQRLKELQRQFRTLTDDPDGVIGAESSACLDITASVDGEVYLNGTFQRQWVEIAGIPIEELRGHLMGHKVGDLFECEFPASKHDPEHAGKPVSATIKVHGLQQISTPGVDDELAKDGGFDDLEAFRERFEEDYAKQVDGALRSTVANQVIDQIMRHSTIPPLPQEWLHIQMSRMADAQVQQLGSKKAAMEAVGVKKEADFVECFKGAVYREFMQQLALRKYQEMFNVEPGSDEMFESMLDNVRWVNEGETADVG